MSYCWQNVLVKKDMPIHQVLELIDQEALRVALVVDDEQNLLGVVTDGDVRRGILKGISLHSSVCEIMNVNPRTASSQIPKEKLMQIMKESDIFFIPLLQGRKVVGLQTLRDSLIKPRYENAVFIMAGGFGTRLRPLTDNCPKPMLKVGDKPILETVINGFKKSGFYNFYISTHYLPEVIREYFGNGDEMGVNITYVHEEYPLGTGGAIGLLPDDIPNLPIIVMNGDLLTNIDFSKVLNFHNEQNASATMCVREYEYQVPYGVIESDGNRIIDMVEKPLQRFFVNAGIYVISQDIIGSVLPNNHVDMPNLLKKHIDKKKTVLKYPVHEYWLDIGRLDDFKRAQEDIYSMGVLND